MDKSIHHQMSAPSTPAQNGLIERDNRTVVESARSMLTANRLPQKLWGEAIQTAVYLLNISTNGRSDRTPYEMVFGRKPCGSHMRVFGAVPIVKGREKKRTGYQKKLQDRARRMKMVGYERDYTYRLFDADKNTVVISREVSFDET